MRSALIAIVMVAVVACGTADRRPRDLETVTHTVLKPNCALAGCHSTYVQTDGLVLDTTDAVKYMIDFDLASEAPRLIGPPTGDPANQPLAGFLRSFDNDVLPQMPLDGPMANADIELVLGWLEDGAPGSCEPQPSFCMNGMEFVAVHACGPDATFEFENCTADTACNGNAFKRCVDGACVCPD